MEVIGGAELEITRQPLCGTTDYAQLLRLRLSTIEPFPTDMAQYLTWVLSGFEGFAKDAHETTLASLATWQSRADKVVYFLVNHDTRGIKIGCTRNLAGRLSVLRTASSETLSCIGVLLGNSELEQSIHRVFQDAQRQGEWFAATQELLGFILQYTEVPWHEAILGKQAEWNRSMPSDNASQRVVDQWYTQRVLKSAKMAHQLRKCDAEIAAVGPVLSFWKDHPEIATFLEASAQFKQQDSQPDPPNPSDQPATGLG